MNFSLLLVSCLVLFSQTTTYKICAMHKPLPKALTVDSGLSSGVGEVKSLFSPRHIEEYEIIELVHAIKATDAKLYKKLIQKLKTSLTPQQLSMFLHMAVLVGNDEIVKDLIQKKAPVNAGLNIKDSFFDTETKLPTVFNQDDITPLHVSAYFGYQIITLLLLEYGADKTRKARDGSTPMHFAAMDLPISTITLCRANRFNMLDHDYMTNKRSLIKLLTEQKDGAA